MIHNQHTQPIQCQEKSNTLTEAYTLSTSCKSNIWLLPLTKYTKQTPDHTKTVSPLYPETDFLKDSGATPNILNNDTWNENEEYHKNTTKSINICFLSSI